MGGRGSPGDEAPVGEYLTVWGCFDGSLKGFWLH